MNGMATRSCILVTAVALVGALGTEASAQGGINLSWSDCGAAGLMSRNFACTTNSPVGTLYASAIAPVQMDQLNGEESEMLLQTNRPSLSPWWNIQTGGCRAGACIVSFDFTANSTCLDPWSGQAAGGLDYGAAFGAPNRARIRTIGAIPGSTSINNTDEYYFFRITLLGSKTVGTGSCDGCTDGVCMVFTSLKLTQPLGVGDYIITSPISRIHVMFQSGGGLGGQCFNVDPVMNRTWGSVKSMYR